MQNNEKSTELMLWEIGTLLLPLNPVKPTYIANLLPLDIDNSNANYVRIKLKIEIDVL